MASPKERLFMTSREKSRDDAQGSSDEENKMRYESGEKVRDQVFRRIASATPEEMTSAFLEEMAGSLRRYEIKSEGIMDVSKERANVYNKHLDDAIKRSDESRRKAEDATRQSERDAILLDEVRRGIQEIDTDKEKTESAA